MFQDQQPAAEPETQGTDWRPIVGLSMIGLVLAGLTAAKWYAEYQYEQELQAARSRGPGFGAYR